MNRLAAFLACTTIIFATTTAFLLHRLHEQEHGARVPQAATVFPNSLPLREDASVSDLQLHQATGSALGVPPATSDIGSSPEQKAARQAVVRYRLEQLRDPAGRAEKVSAFVALDRENWRITAGQLQMSPDELTQFVAARSERTITRMQQTLECELDAGCDMQETQAAHKLAAENDIADLLGAQRYAQYKAIQATHEERFQADWLNTQLPQGKALTESQTEQFVAALAEVRQSFESTAAQRGEKVESVAGNAFVRSSAVPGTADEGAQRIQSAASYLKDQRERLSGVLDDAQLAQFRATQDIALASYKDWLKQQELWNSVHRPALAAH